ncbi:unnamed protein product [Peniophora sp. CBMAI 1063]|nr:unnamed protein product [Peniophora sp. CBMAI 1063]
MDSQSAFYANHLSPSHGYAVLNPRRRVSCNGTGLRPEIDVGDVVYSWDGQLIRLFNCLKTESEQQEADEDCVFPVSFEPLQFTESRDGSQSTSPITVQPAKFTRPSGPFTSEGITAVTVEVKADVASNADLGFAITARREKGAILATSGIVKIEETHNLPSFQRYLVKNFGRWSELVESQGLGIDAQDLMLVTRVDTTEAWSNISYSDGSLQADFTFSLLSATPANVKFGAKLERRRARAPHTDSGPNPEDGEDGGDMHSPGKWQRASRKVRRTSPHSTVEPKVAGRHDTSRMNQVIFVRGFRGKRRLLLKDVVPKKIAGGADPRELRSERRDGPSDDDQSGPEIESIGQTQPTHDDLLISILDFVLESNTNVDLAVAHSDDWTAYSQCMHGQPKARDLQAGKYIQCFIENGMMVGTFDGTGNLDAKGTFDTKGISNALSPGLHHSHSSSSRYSRSTPAPGGYGQQAPGYGAPYQQQQYHGPPPGADPQLWQWFNDVNADRSGAISVNELQSALIFDTDRSGSIGFNEFSGVWKYITDWQNVFRHFDRDRSGSIDGVELAEALRSFGYNLPPSILTLIEQKFTAGPSSGYGPPPGITFDHFVRACVAVKTLTEAFQRQDTDRDGWVTVNYEDFMKLVLKLHVSYGDFSYGDSTSPRPAVHTGLEPRLASPARSTRPPTFPPVSLSSFGVESHA